MWFEPKISISILTPYQTAKIGLNLESRIFNG